MTVTPKVAMALAAGLGQRMRPLTNEIPKPLIEVAGRTMLDRVLDHFGNAGVERIVVNTHWKAGKIHNHLGTRPGIAFSNEESLLETGGGVKHALPLLGDDPFYVANSDIIWLDGTTPALQRLAQAFDPDRMDALLLMQRTATAKGYEGKGDFFLDPLGVPRRRGEKEVAPLLFAGVQILHPRLFDGAPEGRFSLNVLYDRALEAGRLFGIVHDGDWFHVGTPDALFEIDALLRAREG
ncbi:nucleotidyltransferase family protein [Telmatospirillum sp. J64-1]|uniref:nucleotidyltransferase family protein n=1 Tax=Telmatospirillum sp. J64-1 TaxID=2502183 RepID=UPI00115D4C78|nr:nucleotidyltransferase family protein [Telmatospirillum sp. J64-1]